MPQKPEQMPIAGTSRAGRTHLLQMILLADISRFGGLLLIDLYADTPPNMLSTLANADGTSSDVFERSSSPGGLRYDI